MLAALKGLTRGSASNPIVRTAHAHLKLFIYFYFYFFNIIYMYIRNAHA